MRAVHAPVVMQLAPHSAHDPSTPLMSAGSSFLRAPPAWACRCPSTTGSSTNRSAPTCVRARACVRACRRGCVCVRMHEHACKTQQGRAKRGLRAAAQKGLGARGRWWVGRERGRPCLLHAVCARQVDVGIAVLRKFCRPAWSTEPWALAACKSERNPP